MKFKLGDNFLYKGKYSFVLTGIGCSDGYTSYIFTKNYFSVSAMVDYGDESYINKLLQSRIRGKELVLSYSEIFELFDCLACSRFSYIDGLNLKQQNDHCREREFFIEKEVIPCTYKESII